MRLIDSGIAIMDVSAILSPDTGPGVWVLELDLSNMTNSDDFELEIQYKVGSFVPTGGGTVIDVEFTGKQGTPIWQSPPFIIDADCWGDISIYNWVATTLNVPWKLFLAGTATSSHTGTRNASTGNSDTFTETNAGTYVLMFQSTNHKEGNLIRISFKVDSKVVLEYYFSGEQKCFVFMSDPVVTTTDITVTIDYLSIPNGPIDYYWNLMRVS